MLYQFKSAASGDVIMLEAGGRQMLGIMGKSPDAQGILLPEQMPAAKAALLAAIASEETPEPETLGQAKDHHEDRGSNDLRISLRTRAWPLITLIDHSLTAKVPITWGV